MDSNVRIISLWRRLELGLSNPLTDNELLHIRYLNIHVIGNGSVVNSRKLPLVGALIVPSGREGDDIFSSLEGNIQLLNSFFDVTRLILISNQTLPSETQSMLSIRPKTSQLNLLKRLLRVCC